MATPRLSLSLLFLPLLTAAQQNKPASPGPAQAAQIGLEASLQKQRDSLEKQREAIQRQWAGRREVPERISLSRQFIKPLDPSNHTSANLTAEISLSEAPPPQFIRFDCPRLDTARVDELISAASRKHSLDPDLLRAVMKRESGFKPCAVSDKGAQGLMQLMPATARELQVTDAFDPVQNVQAGAAYLRQMLDRYQGDVRSALAGYNAGPGRADLGPAIPYPAETQNYIQNILSDLQSETPDTQEDLAPAEPPQQP